MNRFIKIIPVLSFFALSTQVMAQKCPSYEKPVRDNFNGLISNIEGGRRADITSVDALISQLDPEMKKDYIFMAKSRSLQEGTVENPRVLLKSRNSELVVSFTAHGENRGGNKVEVMQWNPEEAKYDLMEISFSANGTEKPKVTRNPDRCIECHGKPSQPVWDPYRFWSGQVPFHEDTISGKDSIEAKWYRNYLEKIKNKEGRFKHLEAHTTPENFDRALQGGSYQVGGKNAGRNQFSSTDGVASNMSNQMIRQNACRVMNEMAERPDFNQIKYALAGGLNGCTNLDDFLPSTLVRNAQDYFQRHGLAQDKNAFSLPKLQQDTKNRLDNSTVDKLAAQRWFFADQGLSEAEINKEIDSHNDVAFGYRNFETSSRNIASLRYLMLPLGVDVNRWSMAIDKMSFGHGEIFNQYASQPVISSLTRQSCEQLAEQSRNALADRAAPDNSKDYVCDFNRDEMILGAAGGAIEKINEAVLEKSVAGHFGDCYYCHDSGTPGKSPSDNVPYMPFGDMKAMKKFVQDRPGLDARIMSRITRHSNEPGQMPQGGQPLSKDAISDVKNWFQAIMRPQ